MTIKHVWQLKAAVTSQIIPSYNPKLPQRGGPKYAAHMLRVYEAVTAIGGLNVSRAIIQLPSNLHFKEWEALIESPAYVLMVDCLKFCFPVAMRNQCQHWPLAITRLPSDTSAMWLHMSWLREEAILEPSVDCLPPMVPSKCTVDLAKEGQPAQDGHHGLLVATHPSSQC